MMPHGQNTSHVTYRVVEGTGVLRFVLRPSVHFRPHEAAVNESPAKAYTISATGSHYELSAGPDLPVLRMLLHGECAALTLDEKGAPNVPYRMEESRGYRRRRTAVEPGLFSRRREGRPGGHADCVDRAVGHHPCPLAGRRGSGRTRAPRAPSLDIRRASEDPFGAELVLAADQFIIRPAGRSRNSPARERRVTKCAR